ncbi:hypothetical protein WA577_003473 [Blastocystis sp. JDR]
MTRIHGSAPGKCILFGEHAVVYYRSALCGVVDSLRIHCWIDDCAEADGLEITAVPFQADKEETVLSSPISTVFQQHIEKCIRNGGPVGPLTKSTITLAVFMLQKTFLLWELPPRTRIRVENRGIPEEKGLGGSAALCTCMAATCLAFRAALHHADNAAALNLEEVNALAYEGEVLYHGNPSGIDNTVSCYGGLLRFRKKREGGNEMTPIDAEAVQLVLVDSMLPKNTGRMIEKVKRLQDVLPESVECLFDGIEGLVSSVTREGRLDGRRLREAVEMNQCLLQALGVSCEAIDEIVRVGRQCHFAAKLTGGGGGGCVIAVASDEATTADKELLLKSLRERGYEVQQVCIGGKGVEVEII